ncbi:hypothetical protein CspHIS471_0107690 [Cutaneotrichosporon sp. HIS471]|nr:hypothetical protein CspHIS471_0107690 [Cutaneotrichosporon sp. HIS471]
MPIPPRPIPNPHTQQRRHPRRPDINLAGGGQSLINEGRADVSLLPRGASVPNTLSGVFVRPRSFSPLHSPLGTPPLHSPLSTSPMRNPTPPTPPRREVPLAQLMDGRGRAPRTGAAAALGFDYVPRPTIVPIEDEKITEPQPTEPRSSFWAWRERYLSATPPPVEAPPVSNEPANESALGRAPQTPALEPHITDDDDDDWEHVHADDDHVFGDLELDTDMDASDVLPAAPKGGKAVPDESELRASAPQT